MSYEKHFPNLKYLMQHFHQDWKDIHGNDTAVLKDFVAKNPRDVISSCVADIHKFTAQNKDWKRVDKLFLEEWFVEPPYRSAASVLDWLKKTQEFLKNPDTTGPKIINRIRDRRSFEEYPGLYLLMCQFDELWRSTFGSESNALEEFKKHNDIKDVEAAVGDIKRVLEGSQSDAQIDHMIRSDFGASPCYGSSKGARKWLRKILEYFKDFKPRQWVNY